MKAVNDTFLYQSSVKHRAKAAVEALVEVSEIQVVAMQTHMTLTA